MILSICYFKFFSELGLAQWNCCYRGCCMSSWYSWMVKLLLSSSSPLFIFLFQSRS